MESRKYEFHRLKMDAKNGYAHPTSLKPRVRGQHDHHIDQQKRCRLLELPPELRNQIWEVASLDQESIKVSITISYGKTLPGWIKTALALGMTCKQIRRDVGPLSLAGTDVNFVLPILCTPEEGRRLELAAKLERKITSLLAAGLRPRLVRIHLDTNNEPCRLHFGLTYANAFSAVKEVVVLLRKAGVEARLALHLSLEDGQQPVFSDVGLESVEQIKADIGACHKAAYGERVRAQARANLSYLIIIAISRLFPREQNALGPL